MAKLGTAKATLSKYRQLIGIAIAGIILSVIFVPFQNAEAFTVTIDLPDSDDDVATQSAAGESFEITIDIEAGELVSISSVQLILDNTEASVKGTTFDADGEYVEGDTSLVVGNTVEIDTTADEYGYGYGYGFVTDDPTFDGLYSYSFTSNVEDFVGGNSGGSSNPGVTDFVTGFGPGTITISGNIRTADLDAGTHTLDVLIDTGANGNNEDILVATQFEFDVEESEDLVVLEEEVTAGETEVEFEITGFEIDGEPVTVSFSFSAATTTTGDAVLSFQLPDGFFDSLADADDFSLDLSGGDITLTDEDGDEFLIAGLIADLDLSALGLPDGTEITIGIGPYDDSGLSASEEEDLRLFHFNDANEWEALTNDDPTINGGDEVDTDANIVYGTTDDFSLFAPATGVAGGGGDGGTTTRAGGGQTVYVGILPESFLADNPLLRFQINSHGVFDTDGERLTSISSGQQVMLAGLFENKQGQPQDYAFIVQVIDEDGVTRDIGWLTGTLEPLETFEGSRSWTADDAGNYTVRILIWNGIDSPVPLTAPSEDSLRVT